jgi:hypothetical protein
VTELSRGASVGVAPRRGRGVAQCPWRGGVRGGSGAAGPVREGGRGGGGLVGRLGLLGRSGPKRPDGSAGHWANWGES